MPRNLLIGLAVTSLVAGCMTTHQAPPVPAGDVRTLQTPAEGANEISSGGRTLEPVPIPQASREPIGGRVLAVSFEVIQDTRVELLRDGKVLATATTDVDGRFAFPGTYEAGRGYLIRVDSPQYTATMPVEVGAQPTTQLEVLARKRM